MFRTEAQHTAWAVPLTRSGRTVTPRVRIRARITFDYAAVYINTIVKTTSVGE